MRYFFDTEFIEDGRTIDLISIGMVSQDGRVLHHQLEVDFTKANDWIARNVLMKLKHFDMGRRKRSCFQTPNTIYRDFDGQCEPDCPWITEEGLQNRLLEFCDPEVHGKPEFWAYYADYDWVALCQVFGKMIDLPTGWPMYCRDLKQWADMLGNPKLPNQTEGEHNALADARWNAEVYDFLLQHEQNLNAIRLMKAMASASEEAYS